MLKNIFKNYVYPIATLAGSIIGVGFLSLPYITLKVGSIAMLFYFIALAAVVVSIHVMFGQISLKTPDHKRFPGFVEFYLGQWPKKIALVLIVLGSFGILLAYLIIGGQFLSILLQPFFGGSPLTYIFLYFVLASFIIYFGIAAISRAEFLALTLLLVSFTIIFIKESWQISIGNLIALPQEFQISNVFLPYGAILFSLWGVGLIPEVEEMVVGRKKSLKKIIIISTLIPAAVYLIFIFLILGISGNQTTDSALLGLKHFLGKEMFLVAIFMGFTTTFTAFIAQGLLLKKTFMYDMGIKEFWAWGITCATPLVLFLLGFNSFIPLISFVGGVLLSINGILILLMYRKIGGKAIAIYPLLLVFVLGIIYEIVYFTR
ncbi:MAG: hypothetical protein A2908_02960 [Candidatus Staskawiczbacteria bacterium RIFCSPLOWO2_01_FULL_38_12b]|uniref:Amino acid transporter transmembrane domain-containing protein n=1 Tax=Candidatus Staskawiczbacteria bacterium RIFCSPLOWO2_01_FULL_38_12b TaxID=1802214 RepID=A0A1G2IG49_9BACT|nr:MAG: hypothetical protein A2908_02960 [Candidatus Staskawiczbacteria bacterium RIFCSPLOWO2_01_FULL_38_12b]